MATRRVFLSPSFTALQDHAFDWLDSTAGETPESARFLEQNTHQHDQITETWNSDHHPLRLTVSGFGDFALEIHQRLYGPYPDVGTLERRRSIEQALLAVEDDGVLGDARYHTGSISELFRAIEADGVSGTDSLHDRLATTDCTDQQRAVLLEAYEHYEDIRPNLTHAEAMTRSEKLVEVAETEQSLQEAFPHLDAIVISGPVDPTAVELAVLERLTEEFPIRVLIPTSTPGEPTAGIGGALEETVDELDDLGFDRQRIPQEEPTPLADTVTTLYKPVQNAETPAELSWHEAPTPDREIRHLARRLRDRLATDDSCTADDILVLAPGLLSYRDGIADVFEAYGVDHAYRVSILLERTYVGRAVLDVIELCEHPRADRIAQLATNPVVTLPDVDVTEVTDVQRRLYTSAIDAFTRELDDSASGIDALLECTESVREADASGLIPAFEALLEHLGVEATIDDLESSASINTGYESRALTRVEKILDSVATVCAEADPDDPLTEAATALEGVRVPPPTQVTAGRVEIIGLQDTPMASFDELYVLGATAEYLAGHETRPRFFQEIGEELDLFERHSQRDIDRYRFGMVLANASRVHITTPETNIDDEPMLVSPFVDELARVTDLEPTTGVEQERRGAREDLQRAMSGSSPEQLGPALADACKDGHVPESFCDAAVRSAGCGSNRDVSELTDHDAQLSGESIERLEAKLTKTPYSHSRLSRYAKCGFKYLLGEGWDLNEDDDIEPGLDPLTIGLIVHRSVEDFYRDLQSAPGEPVDIAESDRETLEHKLLAAGLDAVEKTDMPGHDVFVDKTLRALFSGLGDPDDNEYYTPPGGVSYGDTAGTFSQFLDTELSLAEESHRPRYFEVELGDDTGVSLPDGRTAPVGGVVDRVDETPDGVTVFDYKASSVNGARRRENHARDGLDFQLPIYSLATPPLLNDETDLSPGDVAARYYIMNADPEVKLRRSLAERFDDIDYEAFMADVIPDRLDNVVAGIENGAFQPSFVGERTAKCEYCEFSDVCDVRHHSRYDVIEHVNDTNHDAYVPHGTGPGDVSAHLPGSDADE